MPDICLGTAQFGMAYGITNKRGQVSEAEVGELLTKAKDDGICWLDTAQAYGNAESIIGHQMPTIHAFKLVSKLAAQKQSVFSFQDKEEWKKAFRESCQRLQVQTLDTLLLHSPADLKKPGGQLLESWLLDLRKNGLVERLGISIYSAKDLDGINPDLLDVVQLPLSIYDQRLLNDGTLARLHANGTAIHARSIYLQGLLLTPASQWPDWISTEMRSHHKALETLTEQRNCQLIDLALGFARAQNHLEAVVVGICSLEELSALQRAWKSVSPWQEGEWRTWGVENSAILDPRLWPR